MAVFAPDLFAVQYLEDGPGVAAIPPAEARARLRAALARLPLSGGRRAPLVLLGWNLPAALVEACHAEANAAGAQLYRWHPLLTGDGSFVPRPEWRTVGLAGEAVPGYRGLDAFTFVCPNRPAVREAVLAHLRNVIRQGPYEGVFLDRIRYPSPAADPGRWLACFCDDCRRAAQAEGVDLEAVQRVQPKVAATRLPQALLSTPEGAASALGVMGGGLRVTGHEPGSWPEPDLAALRAFLDFRVRSVTRFVQDAAGVAHAEGLAVGLDCFSPALAYMVGQDLGALDPCCEWIKIMSYGHALGPAGLPFEILDLANWEIGTGTTDEPGVLQMLSQALHLPLPSTRDALRERGLLPEALAGEVQRARAAGVRTLLAGIELVEIEGVARLHRAQIEADVRALRVAGVDGLALSWDLWHIPLQRLEWVRRAWEGEVRAGSPDPARAE